jgi:predicted xylose isomerase-like sugar epimerase
LNMGNREFASEEVFTVKFSGVNQKDVIINEATYAHEQIVNTNDQINEIDDITHHLPVYYVR